MVPGTSPGTNVERVSTVPHSKDVLPGDVAMINLPEVSERLGISVTREDIHAALLEGQFLDIDEDDVQELLENIEQQARQRIATAARR